jgi:hypothetical protein
MYVYIERRVESTYLISCKHTLVKCKHTNAVAEGEWHYKNLQLLFTSRNCAVCSFLDFFSDTKSYASYVTSFMSDKLVWMQKHTEDYGEDLNLGYP